MAGMIRFMTVLQMTPSKWRNVMRVEDAMTRRERESSAACIDREGSSTGSVRFREGGQEHEDIKWEEQPSTGSSR